MKVLADIKGQSVMRWVLLIVILVVLVALALVAAENNAPASFTGKMGTISGSVSYPSDVIPDGLAVCAENISTKEQVCTGGFNMLEETGDGFIKHERFTYGIGYQLAVPAGTYLVFAQVPGFGEDFRAYYSEFVLFCMDEFVPDDLVNCDDHSPIELEIKNGDVVEHVDPGDWYAPEE